MRRYLGLYCETGCHVGDVARLSKLDFCLDLFGSFLPDDRRYAYEILKPLVQAAIDQITTCRQLNLFHPFNVGFLRVLAAHGSLETCFKFAAHSLGIGKIATIKVYDKVLDLMGREGCLPVGSRIKTIVGSRQQLDQLSRSMKKAQRTGLTRVELSMHLPQAFDQVLMGAFMRQEWNSMIPKALMSITDDVLNSAKVVRLVHKFVDIPEIIHSIGRLSYNCLVIGEMHAWVVNCRTCHPNHFMGTERKISMATRGSTRQTWDRVRDLALRYASAGASVEVFFPDPMTLQFRPVAAFQKCAKATFQPPGCQKPCIGGITLPKVVQVPVAIEETKDDLINGWERVEQAIAEARRSHAQGHSRPTESIAHRVQLRRRAFEIMRLLWPE